MHVDYEKIGTRTEALENAELAIEDPDAPIMNVDANFIVPEAERHIDFSFSRLQQMQQMAHVAEEVGSLVPNSAIPPGRINERPFRRPDIAAEWKLLKKAWSLHRHGKEKLSGRQISEASNRYYASDPLKDLVDWVWRFTLFVCQPSYEPKFRAAFEAAKPLITVEGFADFKVTYEDELSQERGRRYFEMMREYFSAFSEFGQVHFLIAKGIDVEDGNVASSSGFELTKMFYGNAFETFASSVDVLAYLNNIQMGRRFDTFEKLTRKQYLELDKPSRFNSFAMNVPFISLCEERDNQIRNASHHGALEFDRATQLITYRAGKGGTGPAETIGYAAYLGRCTRIFLQAMTLLRTEIMICHLSDTQPPL